MLTTTMLATMKKLSFRSSVIDLEKFVVIDSGVRVDDFSSHFQAKKVSFQGLRIWMMKSASLWFRMQSRANQAGIRDQREDCNYLVLVNRVPE